MLKTHNCGELRVEHVGQRVALAGWVHRHRSHGGVVFINLRDRSGIVQVTFDETNAPEAFVLADQARPEWVLQVEGMVRCRPAGSENRDMPTGQVEVFAETLAILNRAKTPPFYIDREAGEAETLRAQLQEAGASTNSMSQAIEMLQQQINEARAEFSRPRNRTGRAMKMPDGSWQLTATETATEESPTIQ